MGRFLLRSWTQHGRSCVESTWILGAWLSFWRTAPIKAPWKANAPTLTLRVQSSPAFCRRLSTPNNPQPAARKMGLRWFPNEKDVLSPSCWGGVGHSFWPNRSQSPAFDQTHSAATVCSAAAASSHRRFDARRCLVDDRRTPSGVGLGPVWAIFPVAKLWMEEVHFAPPKKPWFLRDPLANTSQAIVYHGIF